MAPRMAATAPHRFAAQARLDTPLGPLTLAATDHGLAGVWFDEQKHHPGRIDAPVNPTHPHLTAALHQLGRFFAANEHRFTLQLDPRGTPFQRSVWTALLAIEPGCTTSYGSLAQHLGVPMAARAVGAAVGRNPLSLVVPCHRVLGGNGSLTGYAGGLTRKQALLQMEREAARPGATQTQTLSTMAA